MRGGETRPRTAPEPCAPNLARGLTCDPGPRGSGLPRRSHTCPGTASRRSPGPPPLQQPASPPPPPFARGWGTQRRAGSRGARGRCSRGSGSGRAGALLSLVWDFLTMLRPQAGQGLGVGGGSGRRPGGAVWPPRGAPGDQGAADLESGLGSDSAMLDAGGFGRRRKGNGGRWEGNSLNPASRESEGAWRTPGPLLPSCRHPGRAIGGARDLGVGKALGLPTPFLPAPGCARACRLRVCIARAHTGLT